MTYEDDDDEHDFSGAIEDPTRYFSHPNEVVRVSGLARHDKLAILESWRLLEVEGVESRDVDEHDHAGRLLKFIDEAIRQLS